ncbi:hypothetical protein [Hoyosella altamirensis]|uniref:Heparin binding hemagglutinin HbhA n=1 Tax=Hoyosella altamirensis TaxID=616997 RepID=A0A839RLX7_9ACTN|nr:hypothetical protein [Hoyosella altamirensis]MBB3037510.1 heparin binding hemagglutinin HbhA [Hoyosella altamirensis]
MARTIESVKTPLFAAVGAGDLAVEAVGGFVKDLRGRAATAATDTQARAQRTREIISSLPSQVPSDLSELRARINGDDLRKQAESYLHNAAGTYGELAQRGEGRIESIRRQPVLEARLSEAAGATEEAIEELTRRSRFVRDFATRAVGRIASRSEKAVDAASKQAAQVAGAASETASRAAETVADVKDTVVAEAAEVRDAAAERVADLADETRETLADAAESAEDTSKDAAGAATDAAEKAKEEVAETAETVKKAPTRRTATKRAATPRRSSQSKSAAEQ